MTSYFSRIAFRINRNILECKGAQRWWFWRSNWVLIETYWNVKEEYINNMYKFEKCINRNILECKGIQVAAFRYNPRRINRNILECKDSP